MHIIAEENAHACARCGDGLPKGRTFLLQQDGRALLVCLKCTMHHRPLWKRSGITSLVVGSVLVAINQGDLLLHGAWTPSLSWKIPLTYAVPFCVAMWGYFVNNRVSA
jgi:hypothetical protein